MYKSRQQLKFTFLILFIYTTSFAQNIDNKNDKNLNDTVTKKENRIEQKKQKKTELKESQHRFNIKVTSVFADLSTDVSFTLPPDGLFSANLSLEDNFGLDDKKVFVLGSFLYFITPRSGLYAQYYNISRENTHTTEKEYTFLDHTIPIGSELTGYFDTKVFSLGYLLTVMRDKKVFLGIYLNVFFMDLQTGVYTSTYFIDEEVKLFLPLPNVGIIAHFELKPWLYFDGNIGFFSVTLQDIPFAASIYNVSAALVFKPAKWLGISASYEMFTVDVDFNTDNIPTNIDYNFQGPALGLSFNF